MKNRPYPGVEFEPVEDENEDIIEHCQPIVDRALREVLRRWSWKHGQRDINWAKQFPAALDNKDEVQDS
jgi:hypothetical protein|tara:strand:+ start:1585 stop:1791 length:207 start_codon:yes stop_codon:yes gene_type:complete